VLRACPISASGDGGEEIGAFWGLVHELQKSYRILEKSILGGAMNRVQEDVEGKQEYWLRNIELRKCKHQNHGYDGIKRVEEPVWTVLISTLSAMTPLVKKEASA